MSSIIDSVFNATTSALSSVEPVASDGTSLLRLAGAAIAVSGALFCAYTNGPSRVYAKMRSYVSLQKVLWKNPEIAGSASFLYRTGILTQENIDTLLQNVENAKEVAVGLHVLESAGILTSESREAFLQKIAQEKSLSEGIFYLNQAGLLTQENFDQLLRMDVDELKDVCLVLKDLSTLGHLTQGRCNKLLLDPDEAGYIYTCIQFLKENDLYSMDTLDHLFQEALDIALGLRSLKQAGILTRENGLLLFRYPQIAEAIADGLCSLHRVDILRPEIRTQYLQSLESMEQSVGFIVRQFHAGVFTESNIRLFLNDDQDVGPAAFYIGLNRAGILNLENILILDSRNIDMRELVQGVNRLNESDGLNQESYSRLVENSRNNSNDFVESNDFYVDSSKLGDDHLQYLLNYSSRIRMNGGRLPQIKYEGSVGIDAGGLNRDFMTRLFTAISGDSSELVVVSDNKARFIFDREPEGLTPEKQKEAFQGVGTIFAHALTGRSFTVGQRFSKSVFEVIPHLLKCEKLPSELSDLDKPEYQEALKTYLISQYSNYFQNDADAASFLDGSKLPVGFDEDLKNDLLSDVKNELFGCALVAKGLKDQLITLGMTTDDIKTLTSKELSLRIQGTLSHEQVLNGLEFDGASEELQGNMKTWIQGLSSEELKKFVWSMTGSETMHPETKLKICVNSAEDKARLPSYHTCGKYVDIPAYANLDTLKTKFELSLAHLNPAEGFQLA